MKLNEVIYKPIITEKSIADVDRFNMYHFRVNPKASKGAITNALKDLFNVDAIDVQTMVVTGKKRRVLRRNRFITTAKWKKAIVKIKSGQKIDLVEKGN